MILGGVPPTTTIQRHPLISFLLQHTIANGSYSCRTEMLKDVIECEHNH